MPRKISRQRKNDVLNAFFFNLKFLKVTVYHSLIIVHFSLLFSLKKKRRMENKGYESIKSDDEDLENNGRHPANSANFLSLWTCWWMNGIFRTGNKRPLEQSDFLPLNEEDKTKVQTEKLQEQWDKHVRECSMIPGKQPKLWKCVLKILSFKEVSFLLSFWFIESVFRITLPLALGLLLASMHSTERNQPLVIGCCFFIGMAGVFSATTHYSAFRCDLLGMRLSSALKGIVYRKVKDL